MATIDMTKIDTAISYIKRMAEGNHPVTNKPAEGDSVINNPNVIRCMYFIQSVLEEVKANDGVMGGKRKKGKLPFPFKVLKEYRYEKDKSISHIIKQIGSLIDNPEVKMISYKPITDWLKSSDYLNEHMDMVSGKKNTVPTEKGMRLGIYLEERTSLRGDCYQVVVYNKEAQEFLIKNLEAILNGEIIQNDEEAEFQ